MAAARSLFHSCIQPSSPAVAARAFLQLASRRPLHILDFLAPKAASATINRAPGSPIRPKTLPKYCHSSCFSTSAIRSKTVAIHNPRKDDDGLDMAVDITPRASNRLREIMAKDSNPNLALRITVESGGCHGFQYLMSLTTLREVAQEENLATNQASSNPGAVPSKSIVTSGVTENNIGVDEDDTVFKATDGSEAKVVMDGPSLELLKGSKIDYTMELIGSQFNIVDNPLATSSCGCGTSFDIKA